ncbi:MAG: TIR domain-containing protein [Acetivibrionales bacterium]|jgi:tetratricopeptide (TPR) repeat protein
MVPKEQNNNMFYDVFLSYRHKPRDNRICKKTHTLLETFKPPRRYKSADIKRVFRDDAELPAAGILSDTIAEALKSSRVLLVICSKDTPESQWVDKEIRTFIEYGLSDKIFALLIDDDPNECFPPSLKLVPGIENRTLRVKYTAKGYNSKKLKMELLKVISEATDTSYEQLLAATKRRRLRRSIFAGLVLSLFLIVSGLYSFYQWLTASYYYIYTQREELVIKDIIDSISSDLIAATENIPEAAPALVKIISDNNEYLDRMMAIDGSTEKSIGDKARNYLSLARAHMLTGNVKETQNSAREAIKIYEAIAEKSNDEKNNKNLATSYTLAGIFMQYFSEYEKAINYFEKAADLYQKLEKTYKSIEYADSLAVCYNSMGLCNYLSGNYLDAADSFINEISTREKITDDFSSVENQILFAELYDNTATCFASADENKKAAKYYNKAYSFYKALYENSDDPQFHKVYVVCLYNLGISLAYEKDNTDAEYYLRLCLVEADKLVTESMSEFDPYYLAMYAMYDLLYVGDDKKEEALGLVSTAYNRNSSDPFIKRIYAYCLLFNNRYKDASDILNTLLLENSLTEREIISDLELFIIRGRSTDDLLRLKEYFSQRA